MPCYQERVTVNYKGQVELIELVSANKCKGNKKKSKSKEVEAASVIY
jgi:hypothetical protein